MLSSILLALIGPLQTITNWFFLLSQQEKCPRSFSGHSSGIWLHLTQKKIEIIVYFIIYYIFLSHGIKYVIFMLKNNDEKICWKTSFTSCVICQHRHRDRESYFKDLQFTLNLCFKRLETIKKNVRAFIMKSRRWFSAESFFSFATTF